MHTIRFSDERHPDLFRDWMKLREFFDPQDGTLRRYQLVVIVHYLLPDLDAVFKEGLESPVGKWPRKGPCELLS